MNFRLLILREMVALTNAWVGAQKDLFLSISEVAGLFPLVVTAHDDALQMQQITEAEDVTAQQTEKLNQLDDQQDSQIRAVYKTLTGNAEHLRSARVVRLEEADALILLRDRLFPEKLGHNIKSYLEESGFAAQTFAQLTPENKSLLARVPMMDGSSALDVITHWAEVCEQLGDVARRRGLLEDQIEGQTSDAAVRAAWAKKVELVLNALENSTAPAETVAALRNPFLVALEAAEKRDRERRQARAEAKAAAAAQPAATSGSPAGGSEPGTTDSEQVSET